MQIKVLILCLTVCNTPTLLFVIYMYIQNIPSKHISAPLVLNNNTHVHLYQHTLIQYKNPILVCKKTRMEPPISTKQLGEYLHLETPFTCPEEAHFKGCVRAPFPSHQEDNAGGKILHWKNGWEKKIKIAVQVVNSQERAPAGGMQRRKAAAPAARWGLT